MSTQRGAFSIAEMTWPEAKEKFATSSIAILATGAQEQHGPYLACNTDIAAASVFAELLAAQTQPETVLCPPFPYGISPHHAHFPGTLSLSPEGFMGAIFDVCRSLQDQGMKRVFIVNGHGGNQAALSILSSELRRQLDLRMAYCLWPVLGMDAVKQHTQGLKIGHACVLETSMMLYLCPTGVRTDKIVEGEVLDSARETPVYSDVTQFEYFEEITANGAFDGAPNATEEIGRLLTEEALEKAKKFLEAFSRGI